MQVATTARGRAAERSNGGGDGAASFTKEDGKVVKTVNGLRCVAARFAYTGPESLLLRSLFMHEVSMRK